MSNLGALTFAFGSQYQEMAALQAHSWATAGIELTVVVDEPVGFKLSNSPARITTIGKRIWKPFEFERLAYELSPYQTTIKTDADVFVPGAWPGLPSWCTSLPFVSGVPYTLYGAAVPSSPYREAWAVYGLPEVYSAFCTFTKGPSAEQFFLDVGRVFDVFYTAGYQAMAPHPSTDLAYSVAFAHLDQYQRYGTGLPFHHMKSQTSGAFGLPDAWTDSVSIIRNPTSNYLTLNGLEIQYPLHYYDKRFENLV